MMLTQMLGPTIQNNHDAQPVLAQKLYMNFGTFARALFTMFEITLANWVPPCRMLMEDVSGWWAIFFVIYKMSVGFAVLKVITAVFIQQTMKVASSDREIMITNKTRAAAKYAENLRSIFADMDQDGSGQLSVEEFKDALQNPKMKSFLAALELEVNESRNLFQMLDDGDGEVSYDEFIYGAKRMKGIAQSIDLITLMHETQRMHKEVHHISAWIQKLQASSDASKNPRR